MSKTTHSPCRIFQNSYIFPGYSLVSRYDHLGYALAIIDRLRLTRQVDYRYHYFSPVVTIYSAGCVDDGKTSFYRQPAAWPYLCFKAIGQGHIQAGRYKFSLHRSQCYRGRQPCPYVHSRCTQCLVVRQQMGRLIYYLYVCSHFRFQR
jgi:hypothetical protein